MPTNLHTRDFLIALSKSTTWNTVNQPGANEGQLILSEDLGIIARESLPDEGVGDRQSFIQTTDKGSYPLDKKNIRQWFRFDMSEWPIYYSMGSDTTASASTGGLSHSFRPADDIDGLYATVGIEKKDGTIVHSYPTVKFDGFELAGEAGGLLEISHGGYASRFINTGGVTITAMNAVTHRTKSLRMHFDRGDIRMNDQGSATLAAGDRVKPSRVRLTFNRNLEAYHAADPGDNIGIVQEPTGGPHPEIMLELEFPIKTADTYVTDLGADTHKKIHMRWALNATAGAAHSYAMDVYCTNAEILNIDSATDGAGKIIEPIQFRLKEAQTTPLGMSYTDPFYMTVINKMLTALSAL